MEIREYVKKNTKIFLKHQHSLSGIIHVFYWHGLKVEGIKQKYVPVVCP